MEKRFLLRVCDTFYNQSREDMIKIIKNNLVSSGYHQYFQTPGITNLAIKRKCQQKNFEKLIRSSLVEPYNFTRATFIPKMQEVQRQPFWADDKHLSFAESEIEYGITTTRLLDASSSDNFFPLN